MESLPLPPLLPKRHFFRAGPLSLSLDFLIGKSLPAEPARDWRTPFPGGIRIAGINAENVFDSPAGEFGERDLPGLADFLGTCVDLVGQLDLAANHKITLMASSDAVNAVACEIFLPD